DLASFQLIELHRLPQPGTPRHHIRLARIKSGARLQCGISNRLSFTSLWLLRSIVRMSASLRKRPKCCVAAKRRDVPIPDLSRCSKPEQALLDHLVGAHEQRVRHFDAECPGGN